MTEEYQAALEGDNSSYGATSSVPKVCVCVCVWRGGAAPVEMALLYILCILRRNVNIVSVLQSNYFLRAPLLPSRAVYRINP